MRVAIDISATTLNAAGTSTYINELISAFKPFEPDVELLPVSYPYHFDRVHKFLRKIDTLHRETIWTSHALPSIVKNMNAEALHSPAALAPCKSSLPVIVTIHDLYTFRSPHSFTLWQKYSFNYWLPKVIAAAQRIIAISNFTKNEILSFFPKTAEGKIAVIYEGANKRYAKIGREKIDAFKIKYNLHKPFLLSVSTIEPRKNLPNILSAFSLIKDKIGHDLVLVGQYGWKSKQIYNLIHEKKINDRVKFLGFIPIEELPSAYNSADLFIYIPSYEGFGLPPLEAMACGCPVIVSDVASLPEVVGDAAIKVDPQDVEQLAQTIKSVLMDNAALKKFSIQGIARSKVFSWERCAKQTLEVYKDTIQGR